ncbi:MAG: zonular occludens toxin domain-containing protein [Pseudoxanthomonas sp.]
MYFQFTGQPGHGKTVLAIETALKMKEEADKKHAEDPSKHPKRELYVCNVRDFNAAKVGAIEITPDDVKHWHERPEYDYGIFLIDEAYEHGMFPKRGPGMKVPDHVQQVAKHRHRGIDFIMICQSPVRQMDDFLHDLIEEHYHIRRRYGLSLVHVKRWDRFERNPDKAEPLTTSRRKYPTEIFKLYTSTKYDTAQQRVLWFYYAIGGLLLVLVVGIGWNFFHLKERFGSKAVPADLIGQHGRQGNGAAATVPSPAGGAAKSRGTTRDYISAFRPRLASQPWSAKAYDSLSVPSAPPRIFCMSTGEGLNAAGEYRKASCTCLTEQGTRYRLAKATCDRVARDGQYEPFLQPASASVAATGTQAKESTRPAPVTGSTGSEFAAIGNGADQFPLSPGSKSQ